MAGTGKSWRGRGGKTGKLTRKSTGEQGSSPRFSSTSSNPSTSRGSVSLRSLPVQYNQSSHPPMPQQRTTSVPETPPVMSSSAPPQPQHMNSQPPQNSSPPSDGINSPPPEINSPPPQNQNEAIDIDDLLRIPGRELYLTVLDPMPRENTIWFNRDDGILTRKISKILKSKFDGPFYCWTKTPIPKQDQYFSQFAQAYHWDPLLTDQVLEHFHFICGKRMKGMVSQVKRNGIRPKWIGDTLWKLMCEYWATEEAKERSNNASNSRNSNRDGLGPHKHLSGQKSFIRIQSDLEKKLGRKVTIGEVFIATHTKEDGTFVDLKAKNIAEAYEKNVADRLAQLQANPSENDDGTSQVSELDEDEMNEIFLQSTILDERGREYGLGSLRSLYGNSKKRKGGPGTSSMSMFVDMQQQLEAAKRQIEEQAAATALANEKNAARQAAESARATADQQSRINNLEMLVGYLRSKDAGLSAFMEANAISSTTPPTTSTTAPPTTSTSPPLP